MKKIFDYRIILSVIAAVVFYLGATSCATTADTAYKDALKRATGGGSNSSAKDGAENQVEKNRTFTYEDLKDMVKNDQL